MTIGQLIKNVKGTKCATVVHASAVCCLSVEGTRVHLQKLVLRLSKAWELVHERLPEHCEMIVPLC